MLETQNRLFTSIRPPPQNCSPIMNYVNSQSSFVSLLHHKHSFQVSKEELRTSVPKCDVVVFQLVSSTSRAEPPEGPAYQLEDGGAPRATGILEMPQRPMHVNAWQRAICEDWFTSQTAFLEHIVHYEITGFPEGVEDSLGVRAAIVFTRLQLIDAIDKCPVCGRKATLRSRQRGHNSRKCVEWSCPQSGHHHFT